MIQNAHAQTQEPTTSQRLANNHHPQHGLCIFLVQLARGPILATCKVAVCCGATTVLLLTPSSLALLYIYIYIYSHSHIHTFAHSILISANGMGPPSATVGAPYTALSASGNWTLTLHSYFRKDLCRSHHLVDSRQQTSHSGGPCSESRLKWGPARP